MLTRGLGLETTRNDHHTTILTVKEYTHTCLLIEASFYCMSLFGSISFHLNFSNFQDFLFFLHLNEIVLKAHHETLN